MFSVGGFYSFLPPYPPPPHIHKIAFTKILHSEKLLFSPPRLHSWVESSLRGVISQAAWQLGSLSPPPLPSLHRCLPPPPPPPLLPFLFLLPARYEQLVSCLQAWWWCIRCAEPRAESRAEHCSGVESGGGGGAAGMATGSGEGWGGEATAAAIITAVLLLYLKPCSITTRATWPC